MLLCCIRIPFFAVEAERRRRQGLATRLILIGESKVFDCSLGAEASGVRRGMPVSEALGLCHRAEVLPPDLLHYQQRFEAVLDFLGGYSPQTEAGELGAAFLSLDGLAEDPQAYAEGMLNDLNRRLGFRAAAGIAGGKFTAQAAARATRPGLVRIIASGEEAAFLAPLSIAQLPAGEAMLRRLRLLGIETMGEIAALPLGAFQQQFGPEGERCWRLAQGIDSDPLVPRVKEDTVVRRLQLPAPSVALETILAGVERVVFAAYGDRERGGRWVRKAIVRGALDGGGSWELPVPFREAIADPRDAWFAVKCAIERRPPERPVEDLAVELVGLSGESGKQAAMFESGRARLRRQVEEVARQLRVQQGEGAIGKIVEVEPWSRIPERRTAVADLDR